MPRTRHGGKRTPAKPASASGPGALSKRTDGRVPVAPVTGQTYGTNTPDDAASRANAGAAAQIARGGGGGGAPAGRSANNFGAAGIFSPTGRPQEPMTAGVDMGPGEGSARSVLPDDPYLMLRALLRLSPTPEVERLVERVTNA